MENKISFWKRNDNIKLKSIPGINKSQDLYFHFKDNNIKSEQNKNINNLIIIDESINDNYSK